MEPPPDPELELKKQELEIEGQKVMLDQQRVQQEQELNAAKIEKIKSDTERSYSNVRKTESESVKDAHMEKLDSLTRVVQMQSEAISKLTDKVLENTGDM